MDRFLKKQLLRDFGKKILVVSGPRQVGKTTLSKGLKSSYEYLNFDDLEDRRSIVARNFDLKQELLILDEIHKMKKWKSWLKGLYDTQKIPTTLVTGSAKLGAFRKVGDSLAGRYFSYQLFPLDVKEILLMDPSRKPEEALETLLLLGGFPEPFFSASESFYKRWRQTHLDIILRQDLIEMTSVRSIVQIETLLQLMRERAGNLFSYTSLREDLQTDDKTIKHWLNLMEESYVLFKLTPFSKRLKNALTKTPKYYFFDLPRVMDPGMRFENLVALSLLKEVNYRKECLGQDFSLHYVRNRNEQEVDFVICEDHQPKVLIECKLGEEQISSSLRTFKKALGPTVKCIQVVKNLKRPYTSPDGIRVERASVFLATLDF